MLTLNLKKNEKWQKLCETVATAKWMDLIGVLIVIAVAVSAGYATETLKQVMPQLGAWSLLKLHTRKPPILIGDKWLM